MYTPDLYLQVNIGLCKCHQTDPNVAPILSFLDLAISSHILLKTFIVNLPLGLCCRFVCWSGCMSIRECSSIGNNMIYYFHAVHIHIQIMSVYRSSTCSNVSVIFNDCISSNSGPVQLQVFHLSFKGWGVT